MTYLDLARSVDVGTKETKEVHDEGREAGAPACPEYERNELNERSPVEAVERREALQARIVAAATVPTEQFDRVAYDLLWEEWHRENAA